MSWFLGFDTSNYTTSVALYHDKTKEVRMQKQLLPVKENTCGLRQSDAVFLHVKQLEQLTAQLIQGDKISVKAIGVSAYPRTVEGSYMPCFLVGKMVAGVLSQVMQIPQYSFSHQEGHIAAALYSTNSLDLMNRSFYAFHVSGGTTELLKVTGHQTNFEIELLGKTLDLNAGQAIDRVGVMLGLSFPCGKQLEQLALKCEESIVVSPTLKGLDCCLSGVENQCKTLYGQRKDPAYIAKYCLLTVQKTIERMTERVLQLHGKKPLIYAGGVMSNSMIRCAIEKQYNGRFAQPEYSTDNSAGIAILASLAANQQNKGNH